MQIRRFGNTGLKVSELCLGTMTFGNQADEGTSFGIMDLAWNAGIQFFDTANVYPLGGGLGQVGRTEEMVGRWIRARGVRDNLVLATKARGQMGLGANDGGLGKKHLWRSLEDSLRRLQTDYLDLYLMHWPDFETPIEETLETLTEMVKRGYVRYIGCSNYPAWQLAASLLSSQRHGLQKFQAVQPRYNALFRMIEEDILPLCQLEGIGTMVYNPLAGGMLTGRYRERALEQGSRFTLDNSGELYKKRYWNDAVFEAVDALSGFFTPRGKSLTHAALAWVLQKEGVSSAIIGASKPQQLEDSLKALDLTLEPVELEALEGAWFSLPRERDLAVARR